MRIGIARPRRRRASLPLVVALLLPAGASSAEPPAQVAVSPSRVELRLGTRPTTESLTLFNFGDAPVRIDVSVAHWDLDEQNRVRIIAPTEQSLDQWLVVNPLHFSVPPRSSQTVRFSIRPRVRPAPGEHRAMIYFDQALPPEATDKLRVRFRLGVAVYANSGEIVREGELHAVRVVSGTNPVDARLDITSRGTAHVRLSGQYAIWPAERYPGFEKTAPIADLGQPEAALPEAVVAAGLLPAQPVLPATRREILLRTSARLPPGSYVLDVNGELPGESIDLGIPFVVPDPARASGPDPG